MITPDEEIEVITTFLDAHREQSAYADINNKSI